MANTRALTPEREAHALDLIRAGRTIVQVAAALDVSYRTVSRLAKSAGVTARRGHRADASIIPASSLSAVPARYAAGESSGAIARDLGVSDVRVLSLVHAAGVALRPQGILGERDHLRIVVRYLAGESARAIAADYGMSETGVLSALARTGTPRRDAASARRVYPLDETAFAAMNLHACYWAGFLMADGSVQPSGRIAVLLKDCDDGQLDALRRFLGSPTKPIAYRRTEPGHDFGPAAGGRYCHITFDSLPLTTDLSRYGVVPRKSWGEGATVEVASSAEFWRGVIDGDGTLSFCAAKNGYPSLSLVGTERLMGQFAVFLAGCMTDGWEPRVHRVVGTGARRPVGLYRVSVAGTRALSAARILYPRGAYALARKRARADRLLAWRSPAEVRSWAVA